MKGPLTLRQWMMTLSPVHKCHLVKSDPASFAQVLDFTKRHEVRRDDRDYQVGDRLLLMEWLPEPGYSGRCIRALITAKTSGGSYGLPADLCVLSIVNYSNWDNDSCKGSGAVAVAP